MATCSDDNASFNNLAPTQFQVVIDRIPETVYRAQSISLPNVDLPPANVPTPTINIPMPGDHLEYGIFSMQFILDERLKNYQEIYDWMKALAPPEKLAAYNLSSRDKLERIYARVNNRKDTWTSDIGVTLLTGTSNRSVDFILRDAYPTALSNFDMSVQNTSVEYVTASAIFAVRNFEIFQ